MIANLHHKNGNWPAFFTYRCLVFISVVTNCKFCSCTIKFYFKSMHDVCWL